MAWIKNTKRVPPINMYAILTVGGRLNPQRSHALPAAYYDNPEKSVKFESEKYETTKNEEKGQ